MSRSAKHKEPLQRIALEMFAALGFRAVSIRDIARATGMAEGTLYRHFSSKEALAQSLYTQSLVDIQALLEETAAQHRTPEAYIPALLVGLVGLYQKDPAVFFYALQPAADMLLVLEAQRPHPAEQITEHLETLLMPRSTADRPARLSSLQLIGGVLYVLAQHHRGNLIGDIDTHIDGLVQTALRVVREH